MKSAAAAIASISYICLRSPIADK